ncbi:MAG: diguanylate cyclase [Gammaproteobacteria bacterium]|nr:diguanylate cyclase [Gammaproteobacteria bacterium]
MTSIANEQKSQQTQELDITTLVGVVNQTGAIIYSKDLDGCYTYGNQLFLDLTLRHLSDLVGMRDHDFFDSDSCKNLMENDNLVLKHGETIEKEEINVIKATGETRIYMSVKKPLRDSSGRITGLFGISTDITKRKHLEVSVNERKDFLDAMLNNVDAFICIKDNNRVFRYANSRTAELFGIQPDEIVGKLDTELLPQDVADQLWELDRRVFDTGQKQTGEEVIPDLKNESKHYLTTKIPFRLADDTATSIGYSTDITELYLLKEKLQLQAITDALTGLYNRRYFNEQCEREFSHCCRSKSIMSIIIIDMDYFKSINDRFGHPVGDIVLREASNIYKSCLRKENILCRIGGEEFAILLPNTAQQEASILAERIRLTQAKNSIKGDWGVSIKPTISLGVSALIETDQSFNDLLSRADRALYKAKKMGRNRVFVL